jgi:hypothetical protein
VTFLLRDAVSADNDCAMFFGRSSLSNDGDRMNLLANPDALKLPDVAVNEGRARVAVAADGRIVGFATSPLPGSRRTR